MSVSTLAPGCGAPVSQVWVRPSAAVKFAELAGVGGYSETRVAGDPAGSFLLTLTNVVVGSAIRVETTAGVLIAFRTATANTEAFDVPAYAPGDAANNLRIKVRKGTSAPFFIPFETQATAVVGSASIFVSQIPDQ